MVQIFEKCLNSCIRGRIFLVGALTIPAFQIIICNVAVKLFQSDKIIGLIFLLGYFLILLFTVVMFSVAAKVNTLSRNWLSRSKWNTCKKWDRKVHRSLTPLRLEFGNNFVDTLTPLVVQQFCVTETASFLLLTRWRSLHGTCAMYFVLKKYSIRQHWSKFVWYCRYNFI